MQGDAGLPGSVPAWQSQHQAPPGIEPKTLLLRLPFGRTLVDGLWILCTACKGIRAAYEPYQEASCARDPRRSARGLARRGLD